MRFVICGVGAIGGSFAGALVKAGREVVGLARGAMLEAIERDGVKFRTPAGDTQVSFPCYGSPSAIAFRPDDVIVLAMKSQDTGAALLALREAGVTTQAIVCAQNGVANERLALRFFPNVYAMTVMVPGEYTKPGEVICYGEPRHGLLDIGRYPKGTDGTVDAIAEAFDAANFAVTKMDDVMRSKYGKLLENIGNVLEAALGPATRNAEVAALVRAEAEAAYRAAGIADWLVISRGEGRQAALSRAGEVAGAVRDGGSSTQSLRRGAGSIETDYLNGEIVLLGRLHGVATPLNDGLVAIGQELIASHAKPGSYTLMSLKQRLGLAA